jgi:hypothetical protein
VAGPVQKTYSGNEPLDRQPRSKCSRQMQFMRQAMVYGFENTEFLESQEEQRALLRPTGTEMSFIETPSEKRVSVNSS